MRRFPRLRPLVFAIGLAALSTTVFAHSNERGIDPRKGQRQQGIHRRDNCGPPGNGKLAGMKLGEPSLYIDNEE